LIFLAGDKNQKKRKNCKLRNTMVGQKIRQYRLLKQLSLEDLTLKLRGQISKMTISKYERSIINPSEQNLVLIAGALDVPVELLLVPSQFKFNLLSFRTKSSMRVRLQDEIKTVRVGITQAFG